MTNLEKKLREQYAKHVIDTYMKLRDYPEALEDFEHAFIGTLDDVMNEYDLEEVNGLYFHM